MSENVQGKNNSSKLVVVLLIVIIVLLVGGAVGAIILLNRGGDDDTSAEGDETTFFTIGYEDNGVVAMDGNELQMIMEGLVRQAEEGMIDLQYKNNAYSTDGVHFTCSIGNAASNVYDMYLNIYFEQDLDQQILLTGLLSPGTKIDNFESEIPLEPGEYRSTLVFTQVEDDHATIHGQAMVVLNLHVGEENTFEEDE